MNILNTYSSWIYLEINTSKIKTNLMKEWVFLFLISSKMWLKKIILGKYKLSLPNIVKTSITCSNLFRTNIQEELNFIALHWVIQSNESIILWFLSLIMFPTLRTHRWSSIPRLKDGFLRIISIICKERKLLNIKSKLVKIWWKGLLIFRALKLWLSFLLKFPTSKSIWLNKKKM